jgi:magnesium transporter
MIQILSRVDGKMKELDHLVEGCWAHLTDPEPNEIQQVMEFYGVDRDFVCAALDEEESAHLEVETDQTLVIVDIPVVQPEGRSFLYTTLPLGIVLCDKGIITVCTKETTIIDDFMEGRVRSFSTNKKIRFLLQILYRNAAKFLQFLKQIDKASSLVENELHKSMKNRELIQMLKLEKSLVYFSTSLKGNELVLEKLLKSPAFTRYPDDEDLLEDVIVENKQAIEMCTIYRDILSGTMDAYASVISNNLNIVMKLLAAVTIILSIPQLVFGLWGMNTGVPWEGAMSGFWYVLGISGVLALIAALIMWRKKMF